MSRRGQRYRAKPPAFTVQDAVNTPAKEVCLGWQQISFKSARARLDAGKALCFCVEPQDMISFWRYFQARIGRAVAVRLSTCRRELWVYPVPAYRPSPDHAESRPGRFLNRLWRAAAREHALVVTIVADCGEWMNHTPCGWSRPDALAAFIAARGDDYPVAFDVATLTRWIDEVESSALVEAQQRWHLSRADRAPAGGSGQDAPAREVVSA